MVAAMLLSVFDILNPRSHAGVPLHPGNAEYTGGIIRYVCLVRRASTLASILTDVRAATPSPSHARSNHVPTRRRPCSLRCKSANETHDPTTPGTDPSETNELYDTPSGSRTVPLHPVHAPAGNFACHDSRTLAYVCISASSPAYDVLVRLAVFYVLALHSSVSIRLSSAPSISSVRRPHSSPIDRSLSRRYPLPVQYSQLATHRHHL